MRVFKASLRALAIWACAWGLLFELDGTFNLANLALLLVLANAAAGMFVTTYASWVASTASVVLFNWFFVEPRYTFNVHLHQDLLLLVTMLGVSTVVSYLMARLRGAAEREAQHAQATARMHALSEALREASTTHDKATWLKNYVERESEHSVSVLLTDSASIIGTANDHDQQGLQACVLQSAALGPGSGRHENQATLFLPVRGHTRALGAVAIHRRTTQAIPADQQQVLQQACDLLGLEIERSQSLQLAQAAQQDAQSQSLRNTLLTSISHDYRTPLANLMGAASAIHDQCNRLSPAQVAALADKVISEAQHLHRITTNTLQLARLDAGPLHIKKDWESLQELLGSVLAKARQRYPQRQILVLLPPNLPLIQCDAILLIQLFDNLLDNAVQYSPNETPIHIQGHLKESLLQINVIDLGPGIAHAWKDKVFQAFERVHENHQRADASDMHQPRRGMGVGLAVCKAIAKVHDAQIWIEDNAPHGTVVCLALPVQAQPPTPLQDLSTWR